jgi:hypothetical protein
MKQNYRDIMDRIDEEPKWFDVFGVPRYEEPLIPPHLMGRIRCQSCHREFYVALVDEVYNRDPFEQLFSDNQSTSNVVQDYEANTEVVNGIRVVKDVEAMLRGVHLSLAPNWHYGDPPSHGCVGDTMNSLPEHRWTEEMEVETKPVALDEVIDEIETLVDKMNRE